MAEIFKQTKIEVRHVFVIIFAVRKPNQVKYGERSLRCLGPKIWNKLPHSIMSSENLLIFKKNIKTWGGELCNCAMCCKC